MANEWQVESEYAESLTAPAVTPAQTESAYAEALAIPATTTAQVGSAYIEVLHTWTDVLAVASVYAEVLQAYVPTEVWVASVYAEVLSQVVVVPPGSSGHVYDSTGALRPVWRMTDSGLVPVDLLTKVETP